MIERKNVSLQALRLPAGWSVEYNKFLDLEPEGELKVKGMPDNDNGWMLFEQDLLYIKYPSRDLAIDLGWYPDWDKNGNFRAMLIRSNEWQHPLEQYETRSKDEVVEKINEWLMNVHLGKYAVRQQQSV